jgi:hypothetical protein
MVPPVMFLAIVLTANHYIIDAVLGGMVSLTGLAIAYALMRQPDYEHTLEGGGRVSGHG